MIAGERCSLRRYQTGDVERLVALAGDIEVARYTSHAFPHPYTAEHARAWIAKAGAEAPLNSLAVDVGGALAGGVGIVPQTGESRGVALFGYWIGREYWGRGIATEAAWLLARYALEERGFRRLEAYTYAPNLASARVLEKCGFTREAVLREAVVDRDGTVMDAFLYARLRSEG